MKLEISHRGAVSTITLPILQIAQKTTTKYFNRFDTRLESNVKIAKMAKHLHTASISLSHEGALKSLKELQTIRDTAIAALSFYATELRKAAAFLEGGNDSPEVDFIAALIELKTNGTDVQRSTMAATLRQAASVIEVELAASQNNAKRVKSAIAVCEAEAKTAMDALYFELKEKSFLVDEQEVEKRLQSNLAKLVAEKERRASAYDTESSKERLKAFYTERLPGYEAEIKSEMQTLKLKHAFELVKLNEVANKSYDDYIVVKNRHQRNFFKKGIAK